MGVTDTASRRDRSAGSNDPDPSAKMKTEDDTDFSGMKVISETDNNFFRRRGSRKPDWSGFLQHGRRETGSNNYGNTFPEHGEMRWKLEG